MSSEAIEELIAQCVADALATYETNRNTKNGNGNGSGSQSDGGNGSRKTAHTNRGCTYKEFLNYQPLNFTGFDRAELALLCPRMVHEKEDKVERRIENNPRDDHVQQPPYKRQNVARAYTTGPGKKKEYARTLPLCNKCKFHHTRPCTAKCRNYKRVGHQTKDCRSLVAASNPRASGENQRTTATYYECGEQGHYMSN
ncbi:hypothetical protein Tco_0012271 [Tanacetum coccineum]